MCLKPHEATRLCRIYYHHLVSLARAIDMAIYVQILYLSPRMYNDEMHFTDKTIKAVHMLSTSNVRAPPGSSRVQTPMLLHDFMAELQQVHFFITQQKHHISTEKRQKKQLNKWS